MDRGLLCLSHFKFERRGRALCNPGLMRTSDEEVLQRTESRELKKKKKKMLMEKLGLGVRVKTGEHGEDGENMSKSLGIAAGKKWWGDRESGKESLEPRGDNCSVLCFTVGQRVDITPRPRGQAG